MDANITNDIVWAWNYETARRVLELLSFVGTMVVGTFAFFVFRQLQLAKQSLETAQKALSAAQDDMQIRIQREAVVLAAEQVERFRTAIIRDVILLDEAFAKTPIPLVAWTLENNVFDESSIKNSVGMKTFLKQTVDVGLQGQMIDLLNEFETYALYFVEGAAEEKIAFPLTSTLFCHSIRQLAPLLIHMRKEDCDLITGPYQNIVKLYECWVLRTKKNKLDSTAGRLLKESSEIHVTDTPVLGKRHERG